MKQVQIMNYVLLQNQLSNYTFSTFGLRLM